MTQTAQALKSFFSGFGVPAYSETSVPDDIQLPYITYPIKEPEWRQPTSFYIVLWCRTKGYADALSKADQILAAIGEGARIPTNDGIVVIRPETPLFQEVKDADNDTKALYINLQLNAFLKAGN